MAGVEYLTYTNGAHAQVDHVGRRKEVVVDSIAARSESFCIQPQGEKNRRQDGKGDGDGGQGAARVLRQVLGGHVRRPFAFRGQEEGRLHRDSKET